MEQATKPSFGEVVRNARKRKGLTIDRVAHAIDTHKATVSKIKNGKQGCDVEMLRALAAALDVTAVQLIAQWEGGRADVPYHLSITEVTLLDDFDLLLDHDQERIAAEVHQLADTARAHRAKYLATKQLPPPKPNTDDAT